MSEKEQIINQISDLDEQLRILKPIVDEFKGKSVEDLGQEVFDEVVRLCNNVLKMMEYRGLLSIVFEEKIRNICHVTVKTLGEI